MKKLLVTSGAIVTIASPLAIVLACSTSDNYERGEGIDISYIEKGFAEDQDKHKNVMSSYFNATDMLAALGHYPDFASQSSDKTIYSDYLKPLLGENNTDISNGVISTGYYDIKPGIKIMDGQKFDREDLLANDISTILLNEWERVDEKKFIKITPAIIYTSMADGLAKFNDQDLLAGVLDGAAADDEGTNWSGSVAGLNTYEAFEMFAMGLERAYPGNDFVNKATTIIDDVKANVNTLATKANAKGKTLLVLEVKNENGKVKITQARTSPYTVLYSQDPTRGIGYSFPTPKNPGNLKVGPHQVEALNEHDFKTEFEKRVDEVIVLNDKGKTNDYAVINQEAKEELKSLLKESSSVENNIHIVERDLFYDSVWGIYGLNSFLQYYVDEFKLEDIAFKEIAAFKEISSSAEANLVELR